MNSIMEDYIDQRAHDAATSPLNDRPEPTQKQKESGIYKKGHIHFKGLDIAIENPEGSIRSGIDRDGNEWKNKLRCHYGYIRGTVGKDKDHLDIFIGPNRESDKVFIVNQKEPDTGKFDEHKILIGFNNFSQAAKGYLDNYQKDWDGIISIVGTDLKGLKTWIRTGNTKIPFKGY